MKECKQWMGMWSTAKATARQLVRINEFDNGLIGNPAVIAPFRHRTLSTSTLLQLSLLSTQLL
jgi:hypothetical protein